MSMGRRHFIKKIVGSGLFITLFASVKSHALPIETIEERIRRLFSNCKSPETLYALVPQHPLLLRETATELLKLSDKALIKLIDKNIRLDFSESNVIDLAGWQLSHTEIAILQLIS